MNLHLWVFWFLLYASIMEPDHQSAHSTEHLCRPQCVTDHMYGWTIKYGLSAWLTAVAPSHWHHDCMLPTHTHNSIPVRTLCDPNLILNRSSLCRTSALWHKVETTGRNSTQIQTTLDSSCPHFSMSLLLRLFMTSWLFFGARRREEEASW